MTNFKILNAILLLIISPFTSSAVFNPPPSNEVLDNPHRGYMLWGSNVLADGGLPDNFHDANIYHIYIPWRMIETSDQVFDWQSVEQTYLEPITNAHPNATVVLRLVADYPNGPGSGLNDHYKGGDNDRDYPLFLEQAPLNIARNSYSSCNGDGPGVAPNWNDPSFTNQVTDLIAAFGNHFDGDPRVTAVQVGLLGLWGEWHQSGCEAIGPDDGVKNSVKIAYQNAFSQTPLQTRYSRDPDVLNVDFGFHEDYFPSFTANCIYGFPECSDTGDWNLEYGMTNIAPDARNNWQVNPISGESPLNSQKNTWVNDEADIITVINDYHFSFLGPAGKHEESGNDAALDRIANQLGYRLQINQVTTPNPITSPSVNLEVSIINTGSAPAYHPYQLAIDWVNSLNNTVATWVFNDDLSLLLPGVETSIQQNFTHNLSNDSYSMRLYIKPNQVGGRNITPANQNRDTLERLIVATITVDLFDIIFVDGFE